MVKTIKLTFHTGVQFILVCWRWIWGLREPIYLSVSSQKKYLPAPVWPRSPLSLNDRLTPLVWRGCWWWRSSILDWELSARKSFKGHKSLPSQGFDLIHGPLEERAYGQTQTISMEGHISIPVSESLDFTKRRWYRISWWEDLTHPAFSTHMTRSQGQFSKSFHV